MSQALPAGFRRRQTAAGTLVAHDEFFEALSALGFPDRGRVEAAFDGRASEGRRATAIVRLPSGGPRVHLRPVRHGGLLGPLWGSRILGLARPVQELIVTEVLRARGAPVPRAALVVGWRSGPSWSAVYGTVHVEGACDALQWLAQEPPASVIAERAAEAGRAVRAFHDAGGRHADLHVKNLLMTEGRRPVLVIDLDKARAGSPPDPRRRMQELMRLYRSLWKRGVFELMGRDGREAFLAAYTDGDSALRTALMAHWPREKRRADRHVARYRQPG